MCACVHACCVCVLCVCVCVCACVCARAGFIENKIVHAPIATYRYAYIRITAAIV